MTLRLFFILLFVSGCAGTSSELSSPAQGLSERSAERRALFSAWNEGAVEFELASSGLLEDEELARLWAEDLVLVMVASYRSVGVTAPGQLNGNFERAQRALLELAELAQLADDIIKHELRPLIAPFGDPDAHRLLHWLRVDADPA